MLKKLFILALLGGIAAAAVKKLQGGSDPAGGWQSAYDPAPAPAAPAAPPAPTPPAPTEAAAAEAPSEVAPPPVDIPPAKTDVDPLTDPLPEDEEQA